MPEILALRVAAGFQVVRSAEAVGACAAAVVVAGGADDGKNQQTSDDIGDNRIV
jgi:hypothetical protein